MTRSWGALSVLSLLAVLTTACGSDGSATTVAADPGAANSSAVATASPVATELESTAEVIDAGAEPRAEIRYAPEVGSVQRSTMVMSMASSMTTGRRSTESAVGPITTAMTTEVLEVADDGTITFRQTIDDMTVEGPDQMVTPLPAMVEKFIGFEFESAVNPVGALVGDLPDLPEMGHLVTDKMLENLVDQMARSVTALPVDPVGVGASWRVPFEVEANGLEVSTVTHYTVTDLDDSLVALDVRQEQSAEPTEVFAGARLDSMTANGEGALEIDLAALMPDSSRMDLTQNTAMTIEQDGQSAPLDQQLQTSMQLTSE